MSETVEPAVGKDVASKSPAKMRVNRRGAVSVLVGLTLLSGVVHGYLDGRWSANTDLMAQGSKLDTLPEQVGEWKLTEASKLPANAAKLLRCYGETVRVYRNERTGASVNVALLFGPRGPIAVHVPEICYSSVGTNLVGERKAEAIDNGESKDTLWSVQFATDSAPEPSLDVWYGWSDGGAWLASENPRFWLTDKLYKVQAAGPAGDESTRPVRDFLTEFLPQARKAMN